MKFALVGVAVLGACGGALGGAAGASVVAPMAPADVRGAIDADLGNVLAQTNAATCATMPTLPGAVSMAALAQLFGTSATMLHALASPMTTRLSLPTTAWLDANVFGDANAIGDGVFAIPPTLVCGTPAAADCAAAVAAADPRVRVASAASGIQMFVQLGAAHDEVIAITLTSTSLAATLDLDAIGAALGGGFSGTATAELDVLDAAKVEATIAFTSPVTLAWNGVQLSSATGTPLTFMMDGGTPQIEATLALGATTLQLGDTALALAGATAQLGFDGHALTLDRVTLGDAPATLAKAGQQAISLDLNPSANRTFDAVVSTDADGVETVAVSPSLEIAQSIDHAALGDPPPVYDVTDVALNAAVHGTAGADSLEVIHGTLAIATSPDSYGVVGTDSRCVTSTQARSPSGESYEQLAVATCQ